MFLKKLFVIIKYLFIFSVIRSTQLNILLIMSAGYVALTVIFFVVALAVSLVVYRYYTRVSIKTIPWPCAIWHVLSLYVCIMSFPLLVVDVDAGLSLRGMHDKGETWMRSIWVTIFALSYLCAWITLPVAQMYT